jgi:heat shock protein HslJ
MACEEPMMSLEADYHAALALVRDAAIADGQLTLSGDGAELVFDRLAPIADANLIGTHWTLTTLYSGDTASSVAGKGWLQFDADGTLSGSTGCRAFDAAYVVDGDRLRISDIVIEDNACEAALRDQDELVQTLLPAGLAFAIDGTQLTLSDAGIVGGKGVGYTAAAE